MKSLTQFIIESMINENLSKYEKCKVFKDLFKLYTDCDKPEDLTEDDFEISDLSSLMSFFCLTVKLAIMIPP